MQVGLHLGVLAWALGLAACTRPSEPSATRAAAAARPKLTAIGPKVVSNASAYPVMIYGENLPKGARLKIHQNPPVEVPTHFVDSGHLTALLPPGLRVGPNQTATRLQASLQVTGTASVAGTAGFTVINDLAFRTPYALVGPSGAEPGYLASRNTDELLAVGGGLAVPVGDRPRALRTFGQRLVVAEESGFLRIVETDQVPKLIPLPGDAIDLVIDEKKGWAYVSSFQRDRIFVVDLATGALVRELPAGVNPRALALAEAGQVLVVGNYQSQDVSVITVGDQAGCGTPEGCAPAEEVRLRPGPGVSVIGGRTEKYAAYVMGNTPPRAVVASEKLHVAFVASNGPNVGPNPDRMEVTENGGVSVIELKPARWARHVSIGGGVADALLLDDARGLLYVADSSQGRLVVLDARRLAKSDGDAKKAVLATLPLPAPEGLPLVRPAEDFGVQGRSQVSLHFGPIALSYGKTQNEIWLLSRYTGAVAEVDVRGAAQGRLRLVTVHAGPGPGPLVDRRVGEILYYSDLGNTGMTCDTCHPEGHSGGIMFTKGRPIRIYRGHTVRSIRESPPYFTPSRLPSIKRTMTDVLARNRFHNPDPTAQEIQRGTEFVGSIAAPPNPYYRKDGSLPEEVVFPDSRRGSPARGLALFEGKAGCAKRECHPPPHFTADQSPDTRGRLDQLGTPLALMLRPELQDLEKNFGQPPPSLVGVWDQFPLFLSGAGGNEVQPDGTIAATKPDALRWMLENPAWKPHGSATPLSEGELDDLLAYLYTL